MAQRQNDGQNQQLNQSREWQETRQKQSKTANVNHKIKRSMREKMTERASRECKRRTQGEVVTTLPWLC